MSNFKLFQTAIREQFSNMLSSGRLFRVDLDQQNLWERYMAAFPYGSNPMFRERTEHDCSDCRHFIRRMGNVVVIVNNKVETIWDCSVAEPYASVAKALASYVKEQPISDIFLHTDTEVGVEENHEMGEGGVITWNHFAVSIPVNSNARGLRYLCDGTDIAKKLGEARTRREVFARGLSELTLDAVTTVSELIGQNSLYRGSEYASMVNGFKALKKEYDRLPDDKARELYTWSAMGATSDATAVIRNTAIGTLLIDLSAGDDLEKAVKKFETSIMAPANFKRPTALVTTAQVEQARKKIIELGLASALERRHARIEDISINDVLFADRSVRTTMKGDVFDQIETKAGTPRNLDKVEVIGIEKFLSDVVPHAASIEVMFENSLRNNLVSIIAPMYPEAKRLFMWDNGFSWSYVGEVTDSIKERVKAAGGSVTGELCCRLAWFNYDDLDLHMTEENGHHIYFGNRGRMSPSGGSLDVDMNAGGGTTRTPVENIVYPRIANMKPGNYQLWVNQYMKRETREPGFTVEIDLKGDVQTFEYGQSLSTGGNVVIALIKIDQNGTVKMENHLPSSRASRTVWGMATQQFQRVSAIMLSPNHWEGAGGRGNKHYFFMLDGAHSDEKARGFYNEFLRPELFEHRKVIELVGSKTAIDPSPVQLSGLGFSDTKRQEVLVKVGGSFTRTLRVQI